MNNFLFYLAAFALLLGLLIVVHEFGHYAAARWAGVKVLRFSVGFGRPVFLKRLGRDGTEWALGLFPLGGYVKMLDESEGEVPPQELHRSFNRQSVWKRIVIVAAGPLANFLLALLVYWGLFIHGVEELRPVLGHPVAASAAAAAGIENGEQVTQVGGEPVQTWSEMRWLLLQRIGEQDSVELQTLNQRQEINFRRLSLASLDQVDDAGDPLEKLGLSFFRPIIPPVVGNLSPGGAAAGAGLQAGDQIVAINDQPVRSWSEVVQIVRASPGKALKFEYKRAQAHVFVDITPAAVDSGGREIGRIGAGVDDSALNPRDRLIVVRYDLFPALGKALDETWDKTAFSVRMIGKMIMGSVSWRNINGPVAIADYAGQSARLGMSHYFKFLALVSISLAVLNLLPVPILDGGHLLYYVAEILRGKPLTEKWMVAGQRIGLALMLLLMALAFYNDLTRLIPG